MVVRVNSNTDLVGVWNLITEIVGHRHTWPFLGNASLIAIVAQV